jgi:lysophospholipase
MMKTVAPFFLAIVLLSLSSCQTSLPHLPETQERYAVSLEDSLHSPAYSQKIETFYASGLEGTFEGEEGILLYYKTFLQKKEEKGALLISSGRTEGAVKYKELLYDLYTNGYSLYIHDHRGQGFSGRMTTDPDMGYVSDFDHYVQDLFTFFNDIVLPAGHAKHFLLAHSMGGGIGMSFLLQHTDVFDAAILSSPMLGLPTYVCPMARILPGKRPRYAPGQTGYQEWPFENNTVTHSAIRFERSQSELDQHPDARLGGPSVQWIKASCDHIRSMRSNLGMLETPVLLLSSEQETVVNPRAHARFTKKAKRMGKSITAYLVPGARHEIFMETDEIRTPAIGASLEFFGNH